MTEDCRVDSKIKILLIIHQKGFNKIVGDDVLGIPRNNCKCKINIVEVNCVRPPKAAELSVASASLVRGSRFNYKLTVKSDKRLSSQQLHSPSP